MYRKILEKPSFAKGTTTPGYLCPVCKTPLSIENNDFHYYPTAESIKNASCEGFYEPDTEYQFVAKFSCKSPTCLQQISCLGTGIVNEYHERNIEHGGWESEYVEQFTPLYFHPPLQPFQIPEGCPENISARIVSSFSLMFAAAPSALNEIRSALELLLDHLGIPRKSEKKDGRLNLVDRIKRISEDHENIRDNLLALRIVGNSGSHADVAERTDLFDSYEVMEHVLTQLFPRPDSGHRIAQITQKILTRVK